MVPSGAPRKKSQVTPPGFDPGTLRLVAQRLNHYATPGPFLLRSTSFVTLGLVLPLFHFQFLRLGLPSLLLLLLLLLLLIMYCGA
jgi:hypothetical protein